MRAVSSRVAAAVAAGRANGFGVENLPFGVARLPSGAVSCVSALGDDVVDLATLERGGMLSVPGAVAGVGDSSLNRLLAGGRTAIEEVRGALAELIGQDDDRLAEAMVPREDVQLLLPVTVGDFLDFNASLHHATNMGRLFRPGRDPLLPNWRRMPVGYTGRTASVVASGTGVTRPHGQIVVEGGDPALRPTAALDLEAEVGLVVGTGTQLGDTVPARLFRDHAAGMVLVNDWSARDVQSFESSPLGPFLGKSFATSVSPWLVTMDALEPYRLAGPVQDPPPAPYLATGGDWAYDVRLEIALQSRAMRRQGVPPVAVSGSSLAAMYWTMPQLLAHATVNGAPIRTGDLLASGTVSGPVPGSEGCLLELTWGGERPLALPDGTSRTYLEDGDTVVVRGWAGGDAGPVVSLGEVAGTVCPARSMEV